MTWITDNKGAGPWDFVPQPEKCGYVNNPRWTGAPASTVDHEPCGYWPKGVGVPVNINIYGIFNSGNTIYMANFDEEQLTLTGYYESPPTVDINGLALYQGDLLTVSGAGATAKFKRIRSVPPFDVVEEFTPFTATDVLTTSNSTLLYIPEIEKYFYLTRGADEGRIFRFSKTLAKEARGQNATVITGTDGNLYQFSYPSANFGSWNADRRPVTGAFWSTYWRGIPDNVCDSPITAWGSGAPEDIKTKYSASNGNGMFVYHQGFLYAALFSGGWAIRKINTTTLEIVDADNTLPNVRAITAYNGVIYVLQGISDATVYSFDASTLAPITNSGILPTGDANGVLLATAEGVTVLTPAGVGTEKGSFYLLDLSSLSILKQVVTGLSTDTHLSYQVLAIFDSTWLLGGTNGGLNVVNRNDFSLFDYINPLIGAPYYSQQHIIVQDNTGSAVVSSRCGTSPVWPMPA